MRQITVVLYVLAIAGCATTAGYEKTLDSWLTGRVDDLVSSWGPPDREYRLSNGGQVLEYGRGSNRSVQVCHPTRPICFDRDVSHSCVTRFTTTPSGMIADWAWEGNDCRE